MSNKPVNIGPEIGIKAEFITFFHTQIFSNPTQDEGN
jgi:hypothetical protein